MRVFSCQYCNIFKNSFFCRTPVVAVLVTCFFVLIHQNKEKSIGNPSSDPRQHSPSLRRSALSVLQTLSMAQSKRPTMLQEEITEETKNFLTKIQKEEQIK